MNKENITVTDCHADHLPPESGKIGIHTGDTLKKALASIRSFGKWRFGNIGGCEIELSDGSAIVVDCQDATGGGQLMSSQIITRSAWIDGRPRTIRKYPW